MPLPWNNEEEDQYTLGICGKTFNLLQRPEHSQLLQTVLTKCQVYARMKPGDKQLLVQLLQEEQNTNVVGMCGDGANDCGALKQAHVGVSLSEAEASIAAPFTSKEQNIGCVVKIVREGRCALTTAFQCLKFMALYSMIQFTCVSLLSPFGSNLGDIQYIYIDLIMLFPLAGFMSNTKSNQHLSDQHPPSTLLCTPVLVSVLGSIVVQSVFQGVVLAILMQKSWYISCPDLIHSDDTDDYIRCQENYTLFNFSNFQYIATALVFSLGKPFKRSIFTNGYFILSVLLLTAWNFVLLFCPPDSVFKAYQLIDMHTSWKIEFLLIGLVNFIVTAGLEVGLVPRLNAQKQPK